MTTAAPPSLADRLAAVRQQIAEACHGAGRDPAEVTLIGVSKTFGVDAIAAALRAGLTDLGENRVQEALPKADAIAALGLSPAWHLVGHLQTNKVRKALGTFSVIHSVDSEKLLGALATNASRPLQVFVQVNVSGESTKEGCEPRDLEAILEAAAGLPSIVVLGLMTIAPVVDDPADARPVFAELRRLAERHGLTGLSMGMSHDFPAAIAEGATHVRIGRAIFGERP
jgi:hypothetical protein